MKIGLDLRMLGGGSGIDRYITELSHEILKQDKTNKYVLFFRNADKSANYTQYGQKIVIANIPHYSLAEQIKLPAILKREKLDLVHFPHFNVPIFYKRPFVVTIHDLTHTLFPGRKKLHFFHRFAYRLVFANAIRNSRRIIAVSQSTKNQIIDFFSVDPHKISVVYEGFSSTYQMTDKQEAFEQISKKFGLTKPFILYVGVWRRYKNLPMLAKAFEQLRDRGHQIQLVLAGEADKNYPEIQEQIFSIKYKQDIKAVGRVSDADLKLLYNAARLFILPSLAEGFGLTSLEAAACGVPVACSDIPTLREIMGQGAEYFDPTNLVNMTETIDNLIKNDIRLEELANLGLSRSKHFSWKSAATETVAAYQEALA